jgi:hypothetical protein
MTTPINGATSNNQAWAIEASEPPDGPPPLTLEPVVIEGDAGARQLVQRYDAANPPDCQSQAAKAIEGMIPLAGDFALVLASSVGGPVAVGIALANLFHSSFEEGAKLGNLYECKTRGE